VKVGSLPVILQMGQPGREYSGKPARWEFYRGARPAGRLPFRKRHASHFRAGL